MTRRLSKWSKPGEKPPMVGQVLPGAPVVLSDDAKIAEFAYAAGRQAGLAEAMSHVYRHSGSTKVADDICDAIRAAMEADK